MADYKSQTLAQLKEECSSRGLAVSGTKAVVIARLEADDEENGTSSAPPAKAAPAPKKVAAAKPAAKKAAPASKKRKAADMIEDEEEEEKAAVEAPKETRPPPAKKGKGSAKKLDPHYYGSGTVYEDADDIWDVMLMQVHIGRNNNKFYVLQMIDKGGGKYDVFTRWGRVNEPGQNKVICTGGTLAAAKSAFAAKFKSKTKNTWGPGIRDSFVARGSDEEKYTLMDMADEDESAEPMPEVTTKSTGAKRTGAPKVRASALAPEIQSLLGLCFNDDTIKEQLQKFEIDTNKMPVGRISKSQLEKGRAILEKLAKVVAGEQKGNINELTGQFYTYVPQSFGRNRPPPLNTEELLQNKFDLINTLTDMTVVQDMMAKEKAAAGEEDDAGEVENPMDRQYRDLDCDITVLDRKSAEFEYVSKYFEATKGSGLKLRDVFRIDRKSEAKRYAQHDDLKNRRLLWHGTNVAVVAAILKTGLRIMPHSGGRVGRGIYHASENSKSSSYVGTAKKTGIMFVNEVAMGKPKEITSDDSSLKAAPSGYDSVLAQGWTDPEPSNDLVVELDGRDVIVPQSKAQKRDKYNGSRFSQCEWLVYRESQVRMRYMLRIDWPY